MRLVECFIENFGKLSNHHVTFEKGINEFYEENGWGKSTFAAFLRVMFYGFGNEKKRSWMEREREKYKPWQGGIYGGSLVFEVGERCYRIERTFGTREKEDHFTLYDEDTGLVSYDYSQEIGKELFQLDDVSFRKSVFLEQMSCSTAGTDAIHAKLGDLAENVNDLEHYSLAEKKIMQEMNRLSPNRKTGSVYKIGEKICDLEDALRMHENRQWEFQVLEKQIEQRRIKKEQILCSLESIREKIKIAGKSKEQEVREIQYLELCQRYEKKEREVEALEDYFENGIPEMEELKGIISKIEQSKQEENALLSFGLTKDEEELLNRVKGQWKDCPNSEELEQYRVLLEQVKKAEKTKQEAVDQEQPEKKLKISYMVVGAIAMMLLGSILCMQKSFLGILFLFAGIGVGYYAKLQMEQRNTQNEEPKEVSQDCVQWREQIRLFLAKYPLEQPRDEEEHIHTLQIILVQMASMLQREEKQKELKESITCLKNEILQFYGKYGISMQENKEIQLQNMLVSLEKHERLTEELYQLSKDKQFVEKQYKGNLLQNVCNEEKSLQQLNEEMLELDEQKEVITQELYEMQQQKEDLKQKIAMDFEMLEAKKRLICQQNEEQYRYEILEKTLLYLKRAKERLAIKYRSPLERGVEKYYGYVVGECGQFKMDTNLELRQMEKGAFREIQAFSAGWQDLFGVCIRLALVDAMFVQEKPFLILDDPYVNLDEQKVQGGLVLLEQVKTDYQIIYFTCHPSRMILGND